MNSFCREAVASILENKAISTDARVAELEKWLTKQ
jgi:hypothetical protein